MGGNSTIEWTQMTWNPIVGCSVTSPGCTNCYAMPLAHKMASNPGTPQYLGTTRRVNGNTVWTGHVALVEKALLQPLRRRKPTMWFVNSMGDLFHESVPDEWIDRVFAVMALRPQHTFQILTKRAARMREYMRQLTSNGPAPRLADAANAIDYSDDAATHVWHRSEAEWPLRNLWLGVSAEDQIRADDRIPHLLATPAAVRFVSCEPMLGPVHLDAVSSDKFTWIDALEGAEYYDPNDVGDIECIAAPNKDRALHWVIVGGESGRRARPMHPDWARSLRDQCGAAGVPFFFKQWGEWLPGEFGPPPDVEFQDGSWMDANTLPDIDCDDNWAEDWATDEFEGHAVFVRAGKKRTGRLLDGELHDGMPG